MLGKYKIITLCGSFKFKEDFLAVQKRLTLEGNIVLTPNFLVFGDLTADTKQMLDDMHKRKIDISDEIFVINKNGYIGSSTKSEIEYAIKTNKKVNYLEPLTNEIELKQTIETKDLCLKQAKVEDADKFYENYISKRKNLEFSDWGEFSSADEFRKYFKDYIENNSNDHTWFIYEKDSNIIIGYVNINLESQTKCEGVGIYLAENFKHKGYGTQVMQTILEYLKSIGVKEVEYCCNENNIPSQKLAQKLGFKLVQPRKTQKGSIVYDYAINL